MDDDGHRPIDVSFSGACWSDQMAHLPHDRPRKCAASKERSSILPVVPGQHRSLLPANEACCAAEATSHLKSLNWISARMLRPTHSLLLLTWVVTTSDKQRFGRLIDTRESGAFRPPAINIVILSPYFFFSLKKKFLLFLGCVLATVPSSLLSLLSSGVRDHWQAVL